MTELVNARIAGCKLSTSARIISLFSLIREPYNKQLNNLDLSVIKQLIVFIVNSTGQMQVGILDSKLDPRFLMLDVFENGKDVPSCHTLEEFQEENIFFSTT